MTTRTETARVDPPIESRDDLIAIFASGEKPAEQWRIGTEHEKFVFVAGDHHAPSYAEPGGIRDLLDALTEFGWQPVMEGGNVIALTGKDGSISLEPAVQFGSLQHRATRGIDQAVARPRHQSSIPSLVRSRRSAVRISP